MPTTPARLAILSLAPPAIALGALALPPAAAASPPQNLQPKQATGVDRFLAEHPRFDGRGAVVAIFDTGVDPGAIGLQETPDGRPKIVDLVDGSGSGDVDTSTVIEAGEDGTLATLTGLTGRTLTLDPDWANPTGEWRLGMKAAADLWPRGLAERVATEIGRERDAEGRRIIEGLRRRHAEAEEADDTDAATDLERLIKAAERAHAAGPGSPVHDCVVFHDGDHWRAVVDTDEDGDLRDEQAMTNFRTFREWTTFSEIDRLNFAVNIYKDGDLLSIVTDCGAHGTHVAGMVAAHFPGEEHLDGIAPGAQIISVKIGDHRINGGSTGTGEMRGMVAVLENDVDIVNMSYGGATGFPNSGLQGQLMDELVNRHGVMFVASAGNNGPALSTVGSPGGTSTSIIGVGAAVDPDMMQELYAVREPHDELAFTWSSRGPVSDGAIGVDITAPGAAIASVPNWQLRRATLMNGTSMSSPSTAGGLALLVSGLKAEDRPVDPHSIKRAITRTARELPTTSVFGQGAGMLQVDAAWNWLVEHADAPDTGMRYEVTVDDGRGILLREPHETAEPHVTRVTIDPIFHEDEDHRRRIEFAMDLELEPSADWIDVAPGLHMVHGGGGFEVRVDPTRLDPGVHAGRIDVYDAAGRARGPVTSVPVTVIRGERLDGPRDEDPRLERRLAFEPGTIRRTFVEIPDNARWADLELVRADDADSSRRYWVQSVQMLEDRAFLERHLDSRATIDADGRWQGSIPVVAGGTIEIAIAHFWSSMGDSELDMSLSFRGLGPDGEMITIDGSHRLTPIDVHARLGDHPIAPSASFTHARRTLPASSAEISPMGPVRDRLPLDRLAHELVTVHPFTLDTDASIRTIAPTRNMAGVDGEVFSQIVHVYEAGTGRRASSRSAWNDDPISLTKGDWEIHSHLVALDRAVLEGAKDFTVQIDLELPKAISPRISGEPSGPGRGDGGSAAMRVEAGGSKRVYLGLPARKDWPELVRPGDLLVGTIGFGDADGIPRGNGRRPGSWPLMATVPAGSAETPSQKPGMKSEADSGGGTSPVAGDPNAALADAIRDARIANLAQRDGEDLDRLVAELASEFPDHRPLHRAILDRRAAIAKATEGDDAAAAWEAVVGAADVLAARIDRQALAAAMAVPPVEQEDDSAGDDDEHDGELGDDSGNDSAAIDVDAERGDLGRALHMRAEALLHLARYAESAADSAAAQAVDEAIKELDRWTEDDPAARHELRLGAARLHGRHGEALEFVNAAIERAPRERAHHEAHLALLRELGWDRWARESSQAFAARFPKGSIVY
ncbi:MAG: S8 family serine peptidase [Phycisphaerales bacterium]